MSCLDSLNNCFRNRSSERDHCGEASVNNLVSYLGKSLVLSAACVPDRLYDKIWTSCLGIIIQSSRFISNHIQVSDLELF